MQGPTLIHRSHIPADDGSGAPGTDVDELAAEYLEQWLAGERPEIRDWLARLDDERARDELRELIEAASEAEQLLPTPVESHTLLRERYRILHEIGAGGMGRVFAAHDEELGRKVAVKMLAAFDEHDADRKALFLRESRLLASMQHPNIVSVHEAGTERGRTFIVMDFVDGRSLAEVIARARRELEEIYPWFQSTSHTLQLIVSGTLIFLIGIPHGAIDHVIYFKAKKRSFRNVILFYVAYVGLMFLYVLVWLLFPYFSLLGFLIISAVHFGQSQFSFLEKKDSGIIRWGFYLVWGGSLLSGLIYYHYNVILLDFTNTNYFKNLEKYLTLEVVTLTFYLFTILSLIFIIFYLKKYKDLRMCLNEILNLALIHFILFSFPPLLGFTLYFVFWHSLRVLIQEYEYLKQKILNLNIERFLKLLLPHSLISMVGAALLIFSFQFFELNISPVLLILIFLSVLTLPHTIVMNRLYQ